MSAIDTNKGNIGLSLLTPSQREIEAKMSKKGASISTEDNQAKQGRSGGGTLAAALKNAGIKSGKKNATPGKTSYHLKQIYRGFSPPFVFSLSLGFHGI